MIETDRRRFLEFDLVLCPPLTTVAFGYDHSMPPDVRRLMIDGQPQRYFDAALIWVGLATAPGLPATGDANRTV